MVSIGVRLTPEVGKWFPNFEMFFAAFFLRHEIGGESRRPAIDQVAHSGGESPPGGTAKPVSEVQTFFATDPGAPFCFLVISRCFRTVLETPS